MIRIIRHPARTQTTTAFVRELRAKKDAARQRDAAKERREARGVREMFEAATDPLIEKGITAR